MTDEPWSLLYVRPDGSYVIMLNGMPYHVELTSPMYPEVAFAAAGFNFPPEPGPPPVPPSPPRFETKNTLYARMTDEELERFDAVLATLPLRSRMEWRDATAIEIDRPDVRGMAILVFGEERAAAILG